MTNASRFGLTQALRQLYRSLRHRRCPIVAIEFEHRGKKYRADTAKEAAELQFHLEQHDATQGVYQHPRVWTDDLALDLLNGIGEAQKKLLALLVDVAGRRSTTLVDELGLDSEIALAGVVSGLSKQLRKMDMSPHDVYRVEVTWKGKTKERVFVLLDDIREAFYDLGFPEAWEGKGKSK